ncbi:MAG: 4-hydroxy-tetrahydrodipicolinate synthase [Verrucomicrobiota bacterium]|nr:4-hydroxy-tetrahydrodipicolinate synthase [Verrucomicrobiota bacterium]
MTNQFSGVYTALSTPMNKGLVSYEGLEALIEHQLNGGINGLVAVGTTGESPTLNNDEHIAVVKATVKLVNGKVPVVAGTGSNSTDEAIKLTQMADTAGADAFLVVAPYYNKPSQEGLFQHFSHIASVTDKPIILYSIPSRCGIEISVDITARLYEKYPHICCMKAAEGSCEKVIDYIRTLGPEFAVMSGDDGLTLPFMSVGATGVISVASNLIVSPLVKMVEAAQANDYTTAQEIFLKFYPFFKAIFTEPNPVPIKYALKSAGVIFDDSVRSPLSQLQADTRKKIDTLVDELDLIK